MSETTLWRRIRRTPRRRRGIVWALGVTLLVGWLVAPAIIAAASPSPTRPSSTDTRSPLEGPGFVGAPVAAIAAVLLIALVAVVVTTVYVRLTDGRRGPPPQG